MLTINSAAPSEGTASSAVHATRSISTYTLPEAAIAYAEAGLTVLPLRPGRKEPCGSLVRHGVKEATTDPERIEQWWKRQPTANIGIRTGGGLVVVDVDPRNGGKLDPDWPDTLTASTASGGWHLYYAVSGAVKTSQGAMAQGVDVKADGGYVVAPPSVRGDDQWMWERVVPMTVVSATVLQGKRRGETETRAERSKQRGNWTPFVPLDVIPEGQRHLELTRWAGWLRGRGYGAVEIEEILSAVNSTACNPSLPEDELDGIVGWAGGLSS
jgi:Bifunctional DNA primase/polymerase, N-terminal/Primase C terminal 1 (PriCT-1)